MHDKASDAPMLSPNIAGSEGFGGALNEFFLRVMLGTLGRYEASKEKPAGYYGLGGNGTVIAFSNKAYSRSESLS